MGSVIEAIVSLCWWLPSDFVSSEMDKNCRQCMSRKRLTKGGNFNNQGNQTVQFGLQRRVGFAQLKINCDSVTLVGSSSFPSQMFPSHKL
jgi:hypothetical protein